MLFELHYIKLWPLSKTLDSGMNFEWNNALCELNKFISSVSKTHNYVMNNIRIFLWMKWILTLFGFLFYWSWACVLFYFHGIIIAFQVLLLVKKWSLRSKSLVYQLKIENADGLILIKKLLFLGWVWQKWNVYRF
jgi:hypothetical protein